MEAQQFDTEQTKYYDQQLSNKIHGFVTGSNNIRNKFRSKWKWKFCCGNYLIVGYGSNLMNI